MAWGDNNSGEANVPAGLSDVTSVAGGAYFSVVAKRDGTVVAWGGDNQSGQTTVPVGLSNVTVIGAGDQYSLALVETPCDQLQAQLDAANAVIQAQTGQIAAANNAITALTGDNTSLQSALTTANASIQSLTTQIAQLQSQLTAISLQDQTLTQFFRTANGDPTFQIPGATLQLQIQNLTQAIQALNNGQQKALYKNLGGKK